MNPEDSEKYLKMLGTELQKRHVSGEILLAGDEVLLLDIKQPEEQSNIDAYLEGDETVLDLPIGLEAYFGRNATIIREVMCSLARQEGLLENWLEDALQSVFSLEANQLQWMEYPGLRIYRSSMDYLLTMKIVTSYQEGMNKIRKLAGKLPIACASDLLTIVTTYIPEQLLTPEIYLFIERLFEPDQIHGVEEKQ